MSDDDKRNIILTDDKNDLLKLPLADNMGGMVLKSLSEQKVSSMKEVSTIFIRLLAEVSYV